MQAFDIVDFGAVHVQQALLVDKHFQAIEFEDLIALVVEVLVEPHTILEARAAAAHNLDA